MFCFGVGGFIGKRERGKEGKDKEKIHSSIDIYNGVRARDPIDFMKLGGEGGRRGRGCGVKLLR